MSLFPSPRLGRGTGTSGRKGPQPGCGHTLPPAATLGSQGVAEEEEIGPLLQGDISVPSPVASPGCWPATCTSLPSLDWAELSSQGLHSDTAELAPSPAPERRDGGSHVLSRAPGSRRARRVWDSWDVSGRFPPSWALIHFPASLGRGKGLTLLPPSLSTPAVWQGRGRCSRGGIAKPQRLCLVGVFVFADNKWLF